MDEQGMGDCLMMARYVPLLKQRGAKVKLYVGAPLVPLFKEWDAIDGIFAHGERISDFDFYASIFDLPYVFETTLETIPSQVPYLPALPPDEKTRHEARLSARWRCWRARRFQLNTTRKAASRSRFSKLFSKKNLFASTASTAIKETGMRRF
jgi:hypothetical protein